jgi:phage shock protein A
MDKQTNTSDMLDEAVEYVKQLKQQVQDLSDTVVQLREMQQQVKGGGIKGKEGK